MKSLETWGASGGEVTGSCHVLTDNNENQYVIDFGMFQGSDETEQKNYSTPGFDLPRVNAFFLTHGHSDHAAGLGQLYQLGYQGPIYATEATIELASLNLRDSAKIMNLPEKRLKGQPPLYSMVDAEQVIDQFEPVHFDQPLYVDGFEVTFRPASHILGASSIEMEERGVRYGETILFTGDLGDDRPTDIVKQKSYVDHADIIVTESTYGDKEHPEEDPSEVILEEIQRIQKTKGTLLIPAFSIHRTQAVLDIISGLVDQGLVSSKVSFFQDGPMATKATEIYNRHKELLRDDLEFPDNAKGEREDVFDFKGLRRTPGYADSQAIASVKGPKVIIAGSGMMSGGRILQHAINYLPQKSTRLLLTGYQAEESLGRQIQERAKKVEIDGETVFVEATVTTLSGLSGHAGRRKLLEYVGHPDNVRKVIVVHGDNSARQGFAGSIKQEFGIEDIVLPEMREVVDLSYLYGSEASA